MMNQKKDNQKPTTIYGGKLGSHKPNTVSDSIVRTLRCGFRFEEKELFPIYNHARKPIFKEDQVREEIRKSLINVHYDTKDIISGHDVNEFRKDFQGNVGGKTEANFTPVAKAEFKATRQQSRASGDLNDKVYSQTRVESSKKRVSLFESENELLNPSVSKYNIDKEEKDKDKEEEETEGELIPVVLENKKKRRKGGASNFSQSWPS